MTIDSAVTAGREPECRHAWDAPLATVAMSTEDEIDGVVVFQLIEDVRRVGEQEGVAVLCARRQAVQIGSVERGIVDADNSDLAGARGNERGLIDQESDFVAIGEFAILINRDPTVVIVVTQRDEDRRHLA